MVAAHYKKDPLLNCWTSSSDIYGYHSDFHEGHSTIGAGQERSMACVNERHVHGMPYVNRPLGVPASIFFPHAEMVSFTPSSIVVS